MKEKSIIKYILGDTTQFIVGLITCIIALVGILFMGGSFVILSEDTQAKRNDPEKKECVNLDSGEKEGFSLYVFFILTMWYLLKENITAVTTYLFKFVGNINKRFTIFVMPLIWVLCIPIMYPVMLFLTVGGIASANFKGNVTNLVFPPSNVSTYFCKYTTNKDDGFFKKLGNFLYWCMWLVITGLLFCMNMAIINGVAIGGALYFFIHTLIRPLQKYKEIVMEGLNYTKTITGICGFIFLILSLIHLGPPLRYASIFGFIAIVLGLLYIYFKQIYDNPEKYGWVKPEIS